MAYIGKSPDGTGVRSRFYYTQTSGGSTSVTGSSDDGTSLAFSDGAYVDVFLNGVLLVAGTDYNTSTANTIAGLAALANGDVVEVVVYDIFTVADTVSALNGGTFSNSVTINRAGNGVAQTIQNSGTTVGAIGIANGDNLFISSDDTNDVGIKFNGDGNRITPCDVAGADRDNLIDLGEGSARYKDLYLGGGAYIGGTGAANYLDDVEEGTFTATLNGGSGHPATRVTTTGYYTKVNTMVSISINFENISTASYSGSISVFGLPFACGNGASRQVFTIAFYETASFSGTGGAFGHLSATGTEIYLLNNRSGNSWENLTHAAGSGRYLAITGTYSAA